MAREYSATVKIFLEHNGTQYDVAQVSNDSLILRSDPGFQLGGYALLTIVVDGDSRQYELFLAPPKTEKRELLEYF